MILQKIYTKLLEYTRDIDVDYSFWGNDTVDSFQYNFDYNSYHHLFELNQDLSDKILKVFIIAGPLNLNQYIGDDGREHQTSRERKHQGRQSKPKRQGR